MKWFREPKVIECCPDGDYRRFLCVAERQLGQITGATFTISRHQEYLDPTAIAQGESRAWRAAYERATAGMWIPEGSEWGDFADLFMCDTPGITKEQFKEMMDALAQNAPIRQEAGAGQDSQQ